MDGGQFYVFGEICSESGGLVFLNRDDSPVNKERNDGEREINNEIVYDICDLFS